MEPLTCEILELSQNEQWLANYVNSLHGRLDLSAKTKTTTILPRHFKVVSDLNQNIEWNNIFPSEHVRSLVLHIMDEFHLSVERIPAAFIMYVNETQYISPHHGTSSRLVRFQEGTASVISIIINQWIQKLPIKIQHLLYLHDFLFVFCQCLLVSTWKQDPDLIGPWLNKTIYGHGCITDYKNRVQLEPLPLCKAIEDIRMNYKPLDVKADARELHLEAAETLSAYILGYAYKEKGEAPSPRPMNEKGEKDSSRLFANHPLIEEWCEQFLSLTPKARVYKY